MGKDTNTKLRQYFKDEASYNNLISIYKELKGKENLHLRTFLKAVVICCLNAQDENKINRSNKWMTPDAYFSPNGYAPPYYGNSFNTKALKDKYNIQIKSNWNSAVFGQYPINYMKQML